MDKYYLPESILTYILLFFKPSLKIGYVLYNGYQHIELRYKALSRTHTPKLIFETFISQVLPGIELETFFIQHLQCKPLGLRGTEYMSQRH